MSDFKGQVALVTGAGTGIGAAIAGGLSARGATVAALGRTRASLEKTAELHRHGGGRLIPYEADISDAHQIASVIDRIASELGGLDVLVNNAAQTVRGTIEEIDLDAYHAMMAVNVDGVIFASRAALPHLRRAHGCIVNVGSVSGLRGDWGLAAYNASKGALVNLTNAMALDHGHEVRVNAVHPGATITNDELAAIFAPDSPVAAAFTERISLGRVARPADVADAVAFLAGDEARFVNGVHLPVDGGLTASNGQPSLTRIAELTAAGTS